MKKLRILAIFLIVELTLALGIFADDGTRAPEKTEATYDNLENDLENDIAVDDIEILSQKAIEIMNEIEEAYSGVHECYKHEDIKYVRKLYTPTTNVILAYLFELENNDNYSYVVMNAFSQEFMQMGAGKSSYWVYLEESGKTELDDNERFIYDSIDCWVGTIQGDEVVIVNTYTNEIVAVEKRDNADVDQQYIDFHTIRVQSKLSELDNRSLSEQLLARALPSSAALTGVGNYTQAQTGQLCISSAITNE